LLPDTDWISAWLRTSRPTAFERGARQRIERRAPAREELPAAIPLQPVAIIGIHQLDAVGKLARLYERLDVAIFIGSGVYGHASIMLDLESKPCATRYERPPIK
jgi:hypothetical protein